MNTGEIFVNILIGGTVGYFTNFLAIKILLKKPPFIAQNPISDNYSEIKKSLSNIIEKDLINHKTIKPEIKKDEFKNSINNFNQHLIKESLCNNIPDNSIKDIPDYNKIVDALSNLLLDNSFIDNIDLSKILNKIDIQTLLNDEYLKLISQKIFPILSGIIVPEFKNMTLDIYDEIKNKKVSDIFNQNTLDKIKENLNHLINEINQKKFEIEPQINQMINDLWCEINADNIFENLENNLKNKSIIDFIGLENKDKLVRELINHFIEFINSTEGKQFLLKLSDSLITMVKDVDSPLLSFLMPVLQVRIFNFLERNISHLADNAKEWLRINKQEIEQIIEDSIEEYYITQNLMGKLKLTVKDLIGLKISEYFQVVEKAIEKFEEYIDKNATKDITDQLVVFLESKKINEIFNQLDLNSESLFIFFNSIINNYLPKIKTSIFDSFLDKPIGDIHSIFKISLKERFGAKVKNIILGKAKDFILSDYIANKLKEIIPQKFDDFKNQELVNLLSREKLDSLLGMFPMLIMFSQGKLIDSLFKEIQKSTDNKKLSDLLSPNIQQILKVEIKNFYDKSNLVKNHKLENIKLKPLYEKIKDSDLLFESINKLSSKAIDNLGNFMQNKVFLETEKQLNKFSSEEINFKIEQSTKKEFQPIILFGAVIGSFLGLLLYFIQVRLLNINTNWISNLILYSVIGMLINLFTLKRISKSNIVNKIKDRNLVNISNFISNKLINQQSIKNIFNQSIEQDFKKTITKDNYLKLQNIINENKKIIAELSLKASFDSVINNLDIKDISKSFSVKITDYNLNNIPKDKFDYVLNVGINKGESFLSSFITKKVFEYKDKDFNFLPDKFKIEVENFAKNQVNDKLSQVTVSLNSINIEEKIETVLNQIEPFINLNIKISDVYLPDESIKLQAINFLNTIIKGTIPKTIRKYVEKNFIEDELSPDKEISTLFNGELVPFIRKNIYILLDKVIFGFGLDKLKDEKNIISQKIIQSVRESNKDSILFTLGESFLSIDKDIKEIVELIIDTKLEPYLKEKKYELEILLTGFIDFISKKKLEEIGLTNDILNSENINILIEKFVHNEKVETSINHSSTALVDNILSLEISQTFSLVGINSLKDIPNKFSEQIKITKNSIFESLENNKDNIQKITNKFSSELINKVIFSQPLTKLFDNIEQSEIENSIDVLTKDIFKTKAFNSYKENFLDGIYQKLVDKKLNEFITQESLENHIFKITSDLINDEEIKNELNHVLKPVLEKLISEINTIIPDSTKEYILDIIIKSAIESFDKNSNEIFKSLNINGIALREINHISPKEIEDLFNTFAKPYFNKIILSGNIGGIIGVIEFLILSSVIK